METPRSDDALPVSVDWGLFCHGLTYVIGGFLWLCVMSYWLVLSKLLPVPSLSHYGNACGPYVERVLELMREDMYYCCVVPLLVPVTYLFRYGGWVGWKLFRHA
ncbi:unnamed protein product [Vitrella brassicaformis CCMP3155]|uniref:Transmembrane protein n=1 Tax=Vitrella brassicaformis (strain CCMP3155) TaxID=1169540 RepID=A0A0G4ER34_VITBC|nr:unnamed protein product [Vitrella brassicaformis CCMP3155]|mmetsp:Transcript_4841/g.13064  ORF Transcript_4841/g.13064 Transcript_4841/m.13064 type:complete len:104 (-) Transcript_4841:219-530(-)|eukprot:CEL99720.1 unnamed protein product [Vitrella brassicaformis CCMP3155]